MSEEEKLYRIKTKEGAHINEKLKEDGSRAAIQFDEENSLQGPVDLIEVDIGSQERSFGRVIMEDALAPALYDVIFSLLDRAAEAGVNAFEAWVAQKVIPAAKAKGEDIIDKAREAHEINKAKRLAKKQAALAEKHKSEPVIHTQEEVDQILNNMKFAALYIAAGIRELSNTVISYDYTDTEKAIEMENKLKELSSENVMKTIDFMLEDRNRELLDQATIQIFEAFKHKDFIVNGEAVPISSYLHERYDEQENTKQAINNRYY